MRLHIGPIPDSPDFLPDESWQLLREPTPWVMQLVALPLGIGLSIVLAVLWFTCTPLGHEPPPSAAELFATLLAIMPIHEAVHLAVHPRTGDSILGFWPSRLLCYTHYHNQLACRRYLAILAAPVLVISVAPLAACALVGKSSAFLAVGSVVNALFASGDLFAMGLLLLQVPIRARLRNKGWRTYWRL